MNEVEGMQRVRGKPKITLVEIVEKGHFIKKVTKSMILDKIGGSIRIHVNNPINLLRIHR